MTTATLKTYVMDTSQWAYPRREPLTLIDARSTVSRTTLRAIGARPHRQSVPSHAVWMIARPTMNDDCPGRCYLHVAETAGGFDVAVSGTYREDRADVLLPLGTHSAWVRALDADQVDAVVLRMCTASLVDLIQNGARQ